MEEVCASHPLAQHVSSPTRRENTLDLVMSDFNVPIHNSVHALLGHSDHAVIVTDFCTQPLRSDTPTSRTVWRYNHADWDRMRAQLRLTD